MSYEQTDGGWKTWRVDASGVSSQPVVLPEFAKVRESVDEAVNVYARMQNPSKHRRLARAGVGALGGTIIGMLLGGLPGMAMNHAAMAAVGSQIGGVLGAAGGAVFADRRSNPSRGRRTVVSEKNPSQKHKKFYGVIGDRNPIEHWGGIVYDQGSGPALLYFQSYEGEGENLVSVYNVFIEKDVVEDLNWVDWDAVSKTMDMDVNELKAYAKSDNVLARAQVYETVAGHYGWSNFDDADEMTIRQAENKYGRMVDAAHKAEQSHRATNPSLRGLKNKLLR